MKIVSMKLTPQSPIDSQQCDKTNNNNNCLFTPLSDWKKRRKKKFISQFLKFTLGNKSDLNWLFDFFLLLRSQNITLEEVCDW